ncbi:MAG: hypothetical protein ACLSB9_29970 [Hydrogeniiclostridium mannosilyticum]
MLAGAVQNRPMRRNALTESNATISASELVVAGNEIAIGVDPTVYPAADYLLNMGAGEILFKADANGDSTLFCQRCFTTDEYTWEIKLHQCHSGAATRPMRSRNRFLDAIKGA